MKSATEEEKRGWQELWRGLKARHSALSRIRSKRRSEKKKNQDRFYKDPFQFARQLFQQPRSGSLSVQKEQLETHLRNTYSDPNTEIPLSEPAGLVWPAAPGEKFNSKSSSLKEINAVVKKSKTQVSFRAQ